ncbi:GNAT family N-acetyltransferase [Microvirga sp. STR05]|uniref:GNAT family N-acetyltransferase n=1 Tax=Hymenobacter duratus TaxID=2771356 RepID=A0ABR8JI40_9BACT|nr:GNAT family N-acetyltransferase [Hymenobacter duratus]MBD2716509.1 GNAT family N-acetyltransferase [Hymenobacter duratus]MBR7951424.1 GNAT family N-acetyltransferase [Microvirga sp. STR05]
MTLTWTTKAFPDLTLPELYTLLQLRSEVFVVEQACAFQDLDGQDQAAYHLLGHTETGELAAYTRLFAAGISYPEASIGRVVVSPKFRRYGLGRELLRQSIAAIEHLFGPQPIQIGAQLYLREFYESFGFRQLGEGYLEDGIPHIHMVRP